MIETNALETWETEGGLAPEFVEPGLDGPLEDPAQTAEREAEEDARDLPVSRLLPVTGSTVVEALETVWKTIMANHKDMPDVVIVTGSGMIGQPRWGHFRADGWQERGEENETNDLLNRVRLGEMFVAGETLARGADHTLETILHEAAHVLAQSRDIQDTSRQNRWHNQKFKALAEELGLEYAKPAAHPTIGFSEVTLTDDTREKYADVIKDLDAAIRLTVALPAFLRQGSDGGEQGGGEHMHHGGRRPKGEGKTGSTYLKLTCACEKPRALRASRKEAEAGQIHCTMCDEYFEDRSES